MLILESQDQEPELPVQYEPFISSLPPHCERLAEVHWTSC
jgi:hypothetical protein